MKNTALVTISTINRTWVLPVGKATRTFLLLFSIVIFCSIGIGSLIIYQFSLRIDTLETKKYELQESVITLNSSAEQLQQKIQSQEFTLVKLQELEELAGTQLDDFNDDSLMFSGNSVELSDTKQGEFLERIDNARLTLSERNWLLQIIPSGMPLVRDTYITSPYGPRKHPKTQRKQIHYGIDMKANIGDDVIATADGVVEFSDYNTGGYGNLIRIRHNYGFSTMYAHLEKRLVKNGEIVVKGQVIAEAGNSGISTGPHLHYEVLFLKKKLNPYPFMKWSLDNYQKIFEVEKHVRWSMLIRQVRNNLGKASKHTNHLSSSVDKQKNCRNDNTMSEPF